METITIEITQADQEHPLQIDNMAIKGVELDKQSMSAMKRKNEEKERMRSQLFSTRIKDDNVVKQKVEEHWLNKWPVINEPPEEAMPPKKIYKNVSQR